MLRVVGLAEFGTEYLIKISDCETRRNSGFCYLSRGGRGACGK